ncbi:MAG: transporter substrate-binding domain-containing protein, partial [Campylobacterales bacterium]|nr:transporter substrate-binding domain-containing protein [Campylobacterales bacterium]
MELLSKKMGVKFEFINGYTWEELVELFCQGEIQLLHSTDRSQRVKECGNFSTKIIRDTTRFVTRKNFSSVEKIEELYGSKVASPKGWEQTEVFKKIDQLSVIEVENIEAALDAVNQGVADFTIGYGNVLNYMIRKAGFNNLKVQGYWNDNNTGLNDLFVGIQKSEPILATIVQKAISSVTASEVQELQSKWFGQEKEQNKTSKIALTEDEEKYIKNNPKITYCFDPIYKPIEFQNQNGIHDGMTKDILDLISQKSGLEFSPLKTTEWSQTLKRLERKECNMIFALTPSPARKKYMLFTTSYLDLPEVLVNKLEAIYIDGVEDIANLKIGILKRSSFIEHINEKHPNINLIELEDPTVALEMVANNKLDGLIEFLPTLSLRIAQLANKNLKIAGKIDETSLNIACHKSEPVLLSILQKSLDSITSNEKDRIKDKWMALRVEKEFDYSLFWKVGIFIFVLILVILYINQKLKSQVNKQVKELRKKDALILQQSKHAAMGELIA